MSGFLNIAPSAGGGAASTVIWSVDFSSVADHDFDADGTTLSLGGVTLQQRMLRIVRSLKSTAGCSKLTQTVQSAMQEATTTRQSCRHLGLT